MTTEERAEKSSRKIICQFLDRLKRHGKYVSASSTRISKVCGGLPVGKLLQVMTKQGLLISGQMVDGTEYEVVDGWESKLELLYPES